jgi:hypothetical protein
VYEFGPPPPDLNGDGTVDVDDLIWLIQSWGQEDVACDIAPLFGDGIVDIQDLEFLMSYWDQEICDPTLVAHWELDEADGIIAYDSAGNCDGIVCGDPIWQPKGGAIDGTLALDGIDDFPCRRLRP